MTLERNNLPSISYWRSNPAFRTQHFYIAFCLFMSCIQDAFIGLKECREENYNWAATCSYYSMVHAGRFLVFLAVGDFPTRHADLKRLIDESDQQKLRFDWLNRLDDSNQRHSYYPSAMLNLVDNYFNYIQLDNSHERIKVFGNILNHAADLRNDNNYESLLIAHEYRHDEMSEAFENLASVMTQASMKMIVPLVIKSFQNYLIFDDPDSTPKCDTRSF